MPTRHQELAMAATSFNIDQKTDQTLENLRRHYQVSSKAEVLRKAIALLNVARRNEHADGTIVIRQQSGEDLKVLVR
jgi:hypothetical protein